MFAIAEKNLEDVRHADQTADFERQEKILKLISTELTKNTTRVVESAVKNVIQNSVLPALETVTRQEVKVALNTQISKGLSDSMKQVCDFGISVACPSDRYSLDASFGNREASLAA